MDKLNLDVLYMCDYQRRNSKSTFVNCHDVLKSSSLWIIFVLISCYN